MTNVTQNQTQTISFRNWFQLNKNEKQIIIDKIRDYKEKNSVMQYLSDVVNETVETNVITDSDYIQDNLLDEYGIDAQVVFSFFSAGAGLCFDAKEIDSFKFLKRLNYKNLFDNKDEKYQKQLLDYLNQFNISTYRINNFYDHENSVRFDVENYNISSDEMLCINEDTELYNETDEFKFFKLFEDEFNHDNLIEYLNEWMHDFCIDSHNSLEDNFDLRDEDIEEILTEHLVYYKNYDKETCSESDIIVFINNDEKILPISLAGLSD
jgi:hypothetical protein